MANAIDGNVLAFDFGEKRIGVALGQALTGSARPLETMTNNAHSLWQEIDRLVADWSPSAFVVGMPLAEDGTDQPMTGKARSFAGKLADRYRISVHHTDERYTTKVAESLFAENRRGGRARAKDARNKDSLAAKLILEQWFEQHFAGG